jgi:DNA polymerase-3 subunit epsilon
MSMDVVVLDTETTGIQSDSERIIEIGAIKLRENRPVSKFHSYVNPQGVRSQAGALAVHESIYPAMIDFMSGCQLVIHNAPFDVGFLNAELQRVGYSAKVSDICDVVDTLVLARARFPGQKNNLDALCKRFGISNEHRTLHGALLDADLLAKVYIQMCVDQTDLLGGGKRTNASLAQASHSVWTQPIHLIQASASESDAHDDFMAMLAE